LIYMPRLLPQFNGKPAVIEHRMTFGDLERRLIREQAKVNRTDKLIENGTKLMVPAIIGAAGFASFYFISKSIDNISRAFAGLPLDNIQQSIRKGGNATRGYNSDGSYPTILTVEPGRYPEGTVRVFEPGLTGGFGSTAFLATINKNYEILVYGNFNLDAKDVTELSSGWLPYSQWKEANEDGREYVS